jgi:hypothetical protein
VNVDYVAHEVVCSLCKERKGSLFYFLLPTVHLLKPYRSKNVTVYGSEICTKQNFHIHSSRFFCPSLVSMFIYFADKIALSRNYTTLQRVVYTVVHKTNQQ